MSRAAGGEARRQALAVRIADALLEEGVAQIPLRDLAARLGTSDRMLLYYFGDKAQLVTAAVAELSARVGARLTETTPSGRRPPTAVMESTARFLLSPEMAPFMNVWADISARGGRGEEPFRTMARDSVASSLAWLEAQLEVGEGDRRTVASAILAAVEGVRMIEAAAPGSTAGVTSLLARSFADEPG